MTRHLALLPLLAGLTAPTLASAACDTPGWIDKPDDVFAADCVDFAFNGSLEERERLAWMFFARVSQLIDDPDGGISDTKKVPVWMAWPTDPDTFGTRMPFDWTNAAPRRAMEPSAEKKDIDAGRISTVDPDGANEEVTRNKIAYDYLIDAGLTTKIDVAAFFQKNDAVDMPVGSVELKASWLQIADPKDAPDGALTFKFDGGYYWWRGLHIMVKMQSLKYPVEDIFYSEEPSWFWTTFEFNDNPGVGQVRENLITQRAPLSREEIDKVLAEGGVADFGYQAYAPNGTQIRFTVDGTGEVPVILGHTDMEDFAGSPNTAQPQYWTRFEASCHACHASAAYNPESGAFFPFSVPTGTLDRGYNMTDSAGITQYLGQGYKPLDFMWPIAFQTK
ncbi:hypothetical protein [Pacificoceanicola onchidii]|uniref:hypothetical protein n=1 Tax=Pacificoceanicola onchidii TaxID=2562685 RepID=UPI0010A50873|nr:hypothetical protein [Pacificoceanicola onchidii]